MRSRPDDTGERANANGATRGSTRWIPRPGFPDKLSTAEFFDAVDEVFATERQLHDMDHVAPPWSN